MNHPKSMILAAVIAIVVAAEAGDVALSGHVRDLAGNGLPGIGLSLATSGLSTSTDSRGEWSLPATPSRVNPGKRTAWKWTDEGISLELDQAGMVRFAGYDLDGRALWRSSAFHSGAGTRVFPVPEISSGLHIVGVAIGEDVGTALVGLRGMASGTIGPSARAWSTAPVSDTLLVFRSGKRIASIPLARLDTSGLVVRLDTSSQAPWNDSVAYGTLYDSRDGQVYRTVAIGGSVWMAENLNYAPPSGDSWLYVGYDGSVADSIDDRLSGGAKYGRLYTWMSAMGFPDSCGTAFCHTPDTCRSEDCIYPILPHWRGICPPGWHVPRDSEWTKLVNAVGGNDSALVHLKASSIWGGQGTDRFGFRALPAGYWPCGASSFETRGDMSSAGSRTSWWSSTEDTQKHAFEVAMANPYLFLSLPAFKQYGYSLRCAQDLEQP
jgi:uncharacterized protein (TIGR02145 family)